ncbi:MAG: NAD-dependent protein deacylase, partial [Lachnospiraceae bacterium]|nr:NAD-dependent protein deacylase [Lachnospiraceae bacterium]
MDTEKINALRQIIDGSQNIVFFGGAGVSTESGIPDFRSADGIYNQDLGREVSPEEMISHTFFVRHTADFYAFYKDKLIYPEAKPNDCHRALAELERQGKVKAVVTQNIDGLHEMAGSKRVYDIHGSVLRNYCEKCGAFYGADKILKSPGVPTCDKCGGRIKPDVVLYEESLDENKLYGAMQA